MFKRKQVVLDSYTTIYLVMKNPKPVSSFQLKINDHFSCTPKTEKVKNYLCGSVQYHALKGGTFEVTLNIRENGVIKSHKKQKFNVSFPNPEIQKCWADLKIQGVSPDLKSAKIFNANKEISFNISGLHCPDFKPSGYKWNFYKYIHFEPVTNCPDSSDFKYVSAFSSIQNSILLRKNSLKRGYYYLCVTVVGVKNCEKLACVSIIM